MDVPALVADQGGTASARERDVRPWWQSSSAWTLVGMAIVDARTWLEVLPDSECWRLLHLSEVARLAVVRDGQPTIWPLNIAVDGRTIVFRTAPGSKIGALQGDPPVAVEVDGLDFERRCGWSVVANGAVHELAGDALVQARRLSLHPWTVGEKPRWFGVAVARISGRAIGDRSTTPPVRDIRSVR